MKLDKGEREGAGPAGKNGAAKFCGCDRCRCNSAIGVLECWVSFLTLIWCIPELEAQNFLLNFASGIHNYIRLARGIITHFEFCNL